MTGNAPNRLAREKSPYLLQHARNPVDWFAWNAETFAKARAENKPVFLSIGYSTCHWCHVMERESFEDPALGAYLNEHFVSIKVDREERPDVDKIYMTFVQSTTGSGGWPLNLFLTPDLKPFYGGTYFPPEPGHGRPSFRQLLEHIAGLWRERQTELVASADELQARLEVLVAHETREDLPLTPQTLQGPARQFLEAYDAVNGGFGGAPKFPQPGVPRFLLRAAKRFQNPEAVASVLHTCERMAAGGIHDQLGGGFARYAVDAEWLVPHFEKMLYDNAQLAQLYLDSYLIAKAKAEGEKTKAESGKRKAETTDENAKAETFAETARDILDYVLRDLTHPDGGFYSAEDADSEGQEGKFYCWTHDELAKLLAPDEFIVVKEFYGITQSGNFVDHSHPSPLRGLNVLSVVKPLTATAEESANHPADSELLASARAKMIAVRARRIRPHCDDKILASWNGLMLGAFARASAVLGEDKYRAAAERNLQFLREKLWDEATQSLYHRWRDGERDQVQLLEGYAFLLDGVIELYEATLKPEPLDFAIQLAESMLARFFDPANGGFWQSPADTNDLIVRVKDDYDGAEPSGNSIATLALLKLAAITGRESFRGPAEATLQLFAHRLHNQPAGMACLLHAVDFWLDEPRRVVIAGDPAAPQTRELLRAAHAVYQPNKIILGTDGAVEPFARTLAAKNEATAYICTGNACQTPTGDPAKIRELLLNL